MSSPSGVNQQLLRQLPSIDKLLQQNACQSLITTYGRSLTLEALRTALESYRVQILNGELSQPVSAEEVVTQSGENLFDLVAPTLYPIINATGIIIHTNLGRAPLSQSALAALHEVAKEYSNLEFDIASGNRGSRHIHAQTLLKRLTQAEDAMVVNNNASAVLLLLSALCKDREVIISRGQLVEIGGGFRIPDVMAQSGAQLVEVGTTNRTHLYDYENGISERTGAIMVAHTSNYEVIGFTTEPSLEELAQLAHKHNTPLLYDQGSGAILDVERFGLDAEPTVLDGLQAGVDVIAFSGDKLLGGPQAGILCGRADLMQQLKRHPLARAIRADKLCLAALSTTLNHYLKDEALQEIPVWQMIARPLQDIAQTAEKWQKELRNHQIQSKTVDGRSRVGGGSLPGTSLPTKLVAIMTTNAPSLAKELRNAPAPIIGRIQDDQLLLDPRTVMPHQEEDFLNTLIETCTKYDQY